MTDYFALLDEPWRPWLDSEALKSRFLARSAEVHPDRLHQAAKEDQDAATRHYAELNAAYHCLREPKDRLQHLLLLEHGTKPIGIDSVPEELMELLMEAGKVCREVDTFLAERSEVSSPLIKVQMFERGMDWTDKLNALQRRVNARRTALEEELKQMNARWDTAPPVGDTHRPASLPLAELERCYRTLSYLSRWTGQLQERAVKLVL
jgi:DnaJ-domain-containing protein 1